MSKALYVPLADGDLRLVPLVPAHGEELKAACNTDQDIWAIYATSFAADHFDAQFARLLTAPPERSIYAVFAGDVLVGMTGWLAHGAPDWSIEIGNTFIVPGLRGTGLNRRIKHLMLAQAFSCGLRRVVFKVDAINARSCAAMRKLGAIEEGIMRAERMTWTGRVRDTVLFAILADEWATGLRDQRGVDE